MGCTCIKTHDSKDGAVVRVLSSMSVLYSAPRGSFPGTSYFSKTKMIRFDFICTQAHKLFSFKVVLSSKNHFLFFFRF